MKTDNVPLIITVKKINKQFKCFDQTGNTFPTDKEDSKNGIPNWRYRKAYNGNFNLIRKYDKNGIIHWKKYDPEKDPEIII